MSPDDRTRTVAPSDDLTRSLADGDSTVARSDPVPGGTPSDVRVVGGPDPSATVVNPDHRSATAPPADDPPLLTFDQFQPLGEIGRGGMGVVYRALDTHFMRDVAVKVLSERLADNRTAVRRFLEEARLTAQLTHTVIPPVHHIGTLADGRPYLAMKLIKGRTLGERLKDRADPLADLPDYLGILEQVCQGVGYAHSRGVIHRDLKPGNVMVGAFGEVQVMDWGLAKEVNGPAADPADDTAFAVGDEPSVSPDGSTKEASPPKTVLRDVRDVGEEHTRAGTILGTPAYMSPEQAAGDVAKVNERSDVFSLGAMLCAVLTGKPPYTAKDTVTAVRKAIDWDTGEAFRRLGQCKADPGVVDLCKRCLARDPAHRPPNGAAVASELNDLKAAAAERLRRADLVEMARIAKRQELKRRRAVQIGLAAAVACILGLLGAAGWYVTDQRQRADDAARRKAVDDERDENQKKLDAAMAAATRAEADAKARADEFARTEAKRAEREAAIEVALRQVKVWLGDQQTARDELAWRLRISQAREGLEQAERRLKEDPTSALAPRVREASAAYTKAVGDGRLAWDLDSFNADVIGQECMGDRDRLLPGRYQAAFRGAGFDPLDPDGFVKKVGEHPFPQILTEAVFHWYDHAADADRKPLADLRRRLCVGLPFLPDWLAATSDTGPSGTKAMARLAANPAAGRQPPWVVALLFRDLWCRGERQAATRVMREGVARHPTSDRLHARFALTLGLLDTTAARREALNHATAALALNPTAALEVLVGRLCFETGDATTAVLHLERAVELAGFGTGGVIAAAQIELTAVYRATNHHLTVDAMKQVDGKDGRAEVRLAAVRARVLEGDRTAAVKVLNEKVLPTMGPNSTDARLGLVRTYRLLGMTAEAVAECVQLALDDKRRLDVRMELAGIQVELADTLPAQRADRLRLAVSVLKPAALDFERNDEPWVELVRVYARTGDHKEMVAAGERAVEVSGGSADAYWAAGFARLTAGQLADASEYASRLVKKAPQDPRGPELRGRIAAAEGKPAEAVRQLQLALRLNEWDADLWDQLGTHHRAAGERAKAVAAFAEAVARAPDRARYQWHLAVAYAAGRDVRGLHHLANAFAFSAKRK